MLPDFGCDLAICHLVCGFDGKDLSFDLFVLKACFQFTFCFTRAKYLDGVCIANTCNKLIVKFVELVVKFSVPLVL